MMKENSHSFFGNPPFSSEEPCAYCGKYYGWAQEEECSLFPRFYRNSSFFKRIEELVDKNGELAVGLALQAVILKKAACERRESREFEADFLEQFAEILELFRGVKNPKKRDTLTAEA